MIHKKNWSKKSRDTVPLKVHYMWLTCNGAEADLDIAASRRGHQEAGQKQHNVSHWKLAVFFLFVFYFTKNLQHFKLCVSDFSQFNTVGIVGSLFTVAGVRFSLQIGHLNIPSNGSLSFAD